MQIRGYRIERPIGRGGMASVYLATQDTFRRQVALKVIAPALASDPEFTRRFLREGKLAAKLQHPNIIKVFDTGVSGADHYLAMEYFPHGTLRERIQQGLALSDALAIVKRIASALDYAHRQGIVHRDIKSQNILLYEDDTPVVSDFGIAKALDASTVLTSTDAVVGSPNYMSPEQIEGRPVDARSDMYSLGVLFYEMLMGQVPFAADGFVAIAYKHVHESAPTLPEALTAFQPVLDRLLSKQPDARFQSGQPFIEALTQAESQSLPYSVQPDSKTTRRKTPRKDALSAPAVTVLLGITALLAAALLTGGFYHLLNLTTQEGPDRQRMTVQQQDVREDEREHIQAVLVRVKRAQAAGDLEMGLDILSEGLALAPESEELLALQQALKNALRAAAQKPQADSRQQVSATHRQPQTPTATTKPSGSTADKPVNNRSVIPCRVKQGGISVVKFLPPDLCTKVKNKDGNEQPPESTVVQSTKNGVPLPENVNIVEPAADVPEEYAKFLGRWGKASWDGKLPHILIVETIEKSGEVTGIYAWGNYGDWGIQSGWDRIRGSIAGGELRLNTFRNGANVKYRLNPDDTLSGAYTNRENKVFLIRLVRPDASDRVPPRRQQLGRLWAQAKDAHDLGDLALALRLINDVRMLAPESSEALDLEKKIRSQLFEVELQGSREKRREIQQTLALVGFDTDGADGVFGQATRDAIKKFQAANEFTVTGYLDAEQYEVMKQSASEKLSAELALSQTGNSATALVISWVNGEHLKWNTRTERSVSRAKAAALKKCQARGGTRCEIATTFSHKNCVAIGTRSLFDEPTWAVKATRLQAILTVTENCGDDCDVETVCNSPVDYTFRGRYTALAVAQKKGEYFNFWVTNRNDRPDAEKTALDNCRKISDIPCEIVKTLVEHGCIAVAWDFARSTNGIWVEDLNRYDGAVRASISCGLECESSRTFCNN